MTTTAQLVPIAKIGRAHGLKGELHLRPYNQQSELIRAGLKGVVRSSDARAELEVEVLSAKPTGSQTIITRLKGISDRTAAEALVHGELCVARELLPPIEEDEIYLIDTVGLPVLLASSAGGEPREIGVVTGVFETGANDVLVVKLKRGGPDLLVPVIEQAFEQMRPETGRVVLAPLELWAPEDLVIEGGEG